MIEVGNESKKYRSQKQMQTTKIVRMTTNEVNVSSRIITYDLYVDGVYVSTFSDICAAIDAKNSHG